MEDEQEEDEESIYGTNGEGMCILAWFVLCSYAWIDSVTYNNSFLSGNKSEIVWLKLGYSSKILCLWNNPATILLWLCYAAVMLLLWLRYATNKFMLLFYYAPVILPMRQQRKTLTIQRLRQPPIPK